MGVRACHEALIMAPLRTVDPPFVSAELIYLVWRTYVEQRESTVRTADCKQACALAPRERADTHPVVRTRRREAASGIPQDPFPGPRPTLSRRILPGPRHETDRTPLQPSTAQLRPHSHVGVCAA